MSKIRSRILKHKLVKNISPETREKWSIQKTAMNLQKNPMHYPGAREKVIEKRKGIISTPQNLFKKGNTFGRVHKGRKISETQKAIQSMKMQGHKPSEIQREVTRIRISGDGNPMKNSVVRKKISEKNKENYKKGLLSKNIGAKGESNCMCNPEIAKKMVETKKRNKLLKNQKGGVEK